MCAVIKAYTMPKTIWKQCRDHKIFVKSFLEIVKNHKSFLCLLVQENKSWLRNDANDWMSVIRCAADVKQGKQPKPSRQPAQRLLTVKYSQTASFRREYGQNSNKFGALEQSNATGPKNKSNRTQTGPTTGTRRPNDTAETSTTRSKLLFPAAPLKYQSSSTHSRRILLGHCAGIEAFIAGAHHRGAAATIPVIFLSHMPNLPGQIPRGPWPIRNCPPKSSDGLLAIAANHAPIELYPSRARAVRLELRAAHCNPHVHLYAGGPKSCGLPKYKRCWRFYPERPTAELYTMN